MFIYKWGKTTAESRGKMFISFWVCVWGWWYYRYESYETAFMKNILTFTAENDGNNETINTQDTSHDNWYDWFEDQFRL
jgi:hypothetical protein